MDGCKRNASVIYLFYRQLDRLRNIKKFKIKHHFMSAIHYPVNGFKPACHKKLQSNLIKADMGFTFFYNFFSLFRMFYIESYNYSFI